jgi:hypothetical protein
MGKHCGRNHSRKDLCAANLQSCNVCKKQNHYASVCRQKERDGHNKHKMIHEVGHYLDYHDNDPSKDLFVDSVDHHNITNQTFTWVKTCQKWKLILVLGSISYSDQHFGPLELKAHCPKQTDASLYYCIWWHCPEHWWIHQITMLIQW